MNGHEKIVDAEQAYMQDKIENLPLELKPDETLVLDISNTTIHHSNIIFDKLSLTGYDVRKQLNNEESAIIVNVKQ
ncbi:MAG: hypothetical protein QHH06_14875 [Clostridiales bacterium]|nr:hypothetical protein [Eubacteriales bacterium]MDH7567722.1 hypothetical protein [Clostridiales bacterium]